MFDEHEPIPGTAPKYHAIANCDRCGRGPTVSLGGWISSQGRAELCESCLREALACLERARMCDVTP